MGILKEGQEAIAEIESEHRGVVLTAISGIGQDALANLAGVLGEPDYHGDVETALIHNVGERAFTDEDLTAPYTDLVDRIKAYAANQDERADSYVPVLFVFEADETEAERSQLVKVDPTDITFHSIRSKDKDVLIYASGATSTVNRTYLHLTGNTTTVFGDITISPRNISAPEGHGGARLRRTQVAEDSKGDADHTFTNEEVDHLNDNTIVLIGWEEIGAAMAKAIQSSPDLRSAGYDSALASILAIQRFFAANNDLGTVKKHVPELGDVISKATALSNSLGKLANSTLVQ